MIWARTAIASILVFTLLWIVYFSLLVHLPWWTHYIAAAVIGGVSAILAELFV